MAKDDNIQRWFAAIGNVSVTWADIEWFIQNLCTTLAPFHSHEFEDVRVKFVYSQAVLHLDMRNRIALAKVLLDGASLPVSMSSPMEILLNKIDNELRPERNRIIHDEWLISEQYAIRSHIRPKIIKTQSRTTELTMATMKRYESVEEIEAFCASLHEAMRGLLRGINEIECHWNEKAPLLKQLQQAAWGKES